MKALPAKNCIQEIYALQLKRSVRRGCKLYAVSIQDCNKETQHKIYDIPILQYIRYVFPGDVPGLPPKRDLYFFINLVPRAVRVSKAPYRMSAPELVELRIQLQELVEKGYISTHVSPWGSPILVVKKKDWTMRMCIDYH